MSIDEVRNTKQQFRNDVLDFLEEKEPSLGEVYILMDTIRFIAGETTKSQPSVQVSSSGEALIKMSGKYIDVHQVFSGRSHKIPETVS